MCSREALAVAARSGTPPNARADADARPASEWPRCQKGSLPKAAGFPITSRSMYWMNRGAVVRRCCHSACDDDETKSGFQRGRVK